MQQKNIEMSLEVPDEVDLGEDVIAKATALQAEKFKQMALKAEAFLKKEEYRKEKKIQKRRAKKKLNKKFKK